MHTLFHYILSVFFLSILLGQHKYPRLSRVYEKTREGLQGFTCKHHTGCHIIFDNSTNNNYKMEVVEVGPNMVPGHRMDEGQPPQIEEAMPIKVIKGSCIENYHMRSVYLLLVLWHPVVHLLHQSPAADILLTYKGNKMYSLVTYNSYMPLKAS
jgi:hypothetical protein